MNDGFGGGGGGESRRNEVNILNYVLNIKT